MTRRLALGLTLLLAAAPACAGEIKSGSFDVDGVKIAYTVRGAGPPVLLIHGWIASGVLNWDLPGVTADLAKDFQVITMDVRGHGLSDKPTKENLYGPELVDDVARLLDHLKIKDAHIVGYSMGGIITAKFAAKHPKRCRSATLCGMGWLAPGGVGQRFFAQIGKKNSSPTPQELCGRSLAMLTLTREELLSIKIPVAVIVGDKDPCFGLYVKPLQPVRKDWPVVEIKNAGHLSCVVDPQFKDELHKWLNKLVASPSKPAQPSTVSSPSGKRTGAGLARISRP